MNTETNTSLRILLVDDDEADRMAVVRALAGYCAVTEATTGKEAVDWLNRQPFDCLLLDYHIPGLDTLKLVDRIGQRLPVVMITGRSDVGLAVSAMKGGAQDFLLKEQITGIALQRAILHAIEKISLLRQIEKQRLELERQATTDGLTGLYNRRCFLERLDEEINRARRFLQPLALLLLDLDHFKNINDGHGHLVGDRVLVHVAHLIKGSLRRSDCAARYGGEEFCVLAIGAAGDGAEVLAQRLRQLVAAYPLPLDDETVIKVTCSIGVAELEPACRSGQQLLNAADKALYRAKEAGRDRVERAQESETRESLAEIIGLTADI